MLKRQSIEARGSKSSNQYGTSNQQKTLSGAQQLASEVTHSDKSPTIIAILCPTTKPK